MVCQNPSTRRVPDICCRYQGTAAGTGVAVDDPELVHVLDTHPIRQNHTAISQSSSGWVLLERTNENRDAGSHDYPLLIVCT